MILCPVVRLDGSQPVRYGLKVEVDERYKTLKEGLSELSGIPTTSLLLVEVYGATIRVSGREGGGEGSTGSPSR